MEEVEIDDEGYSEEDFVYNPLPLSNNAPGGGCVPNDFLDYLPPGPTAIQNPPAAEGIPWDEIARLPLTPDKHLTWDNLQAPIPYRFHPNHSLLYKKRCQKLANDNIKRVADSKKQSNKLVNTFCKLLRPEEESPPAQHSNLSYHLKINQPANVIKELKSCLEKPIYIPLKQFMQHAFHLLSGRESYTFVIKLAEDEFEGSCGDFKKNPAVLLDGISPSAFYRFSQPLIKIGSIVKRLNRYSTLHYDNKLLKEQGLDKNAVMAAFLCYIANYLKMYQTVLMLNSSLINGLTELGTFIKPFRHQLEVLEFILVNNPSGNAVELLKTLNLFMFSNETPYIADLIRGIFVTCSSAYLKYVSDWIFRGVLAPRSEFHIEKSRNIPYRDRRFWTKQFIHSNSVPMFLEESVQLVFETGKAINLLSQIQDENIFTSIPLFCYDVDALLTPSLDFNQVSCLYLIWNRKLEDFLKEQCYLIEDITTSIDQLLTNQSTTAGINFEEIEQIKKERDKKCLAQKNEKYEVQKKKKHEYLIELQDQVEQKNKRKSRIFEESVIQEEKDKEFVIMRDKRDLDEKNRIRTIHFGTEGPKDESDGKEKDLFPLGRGDPTSVFTRINSSPIGYNKADFLAFHDDENKVTQPLKVAEIPNFYTKPDEIKVDLGTSTGAGDKLDTNSREKEDTINAPLEKEHNDAAGEVYSYWKDWKEEDKPQEQTEMVVEEEIVRIIDEEKEEEKFNPDKVITKDPPAYKTCISLDSGLSALKFIDFGIISQENLKRKETNSPPKKKTDDPYCLTQFLAQSVSIPLKAQNRMVNTAVLHYFICEKNLFSHVEALNNFLCLQNGLFGHFLSSLFIQEVYKKNVRTIEDVTNKSGRLNMILTEAISNSVPNEESNELLRNLGFTINKEFGQIITKDGGGDSSTLPLKEKSISSEYEILDSIRLCYAVEWPLNIILTDDLLFHYERLWIFLMQLFRAELLLQRVYNILKFKNVKSYQLFTLHHYHYRLSHFVRTVRNYVNVTVIHTAWDELCDSFTKLNSLERLYEGLVRHIKSISTNCLLGQKAEGVLKLLKNQLVIIESFCSQLEVVASNVDWRKGEEISAKEYKRLTQKFKAVEEIGKVFTVVAYKLVNKGYYPKVAYFLELYNFNGFFNMESFSESKI